MTGAPGTGDAAWAPRRARTAAGVQAATGTRATAGARTAAGARAERGFDPRGFAAALLDLDGVITDTASLHARCWKRALDDFLARWSARTGRRLRAFDPLEDYLRHIDGKPRIDGARDFAAARGLDPTLPEVRRDLEEVARRKDALFSEALRKEGVQVFEGSVRFLRYVRAKGLRTAVVSSSHHAEEILRAASLLELFDARVDGHLIDRLGLPGKPAPDTFLHAAARLAVEPGRAFVAEDALAGVEAGRAGGFGLVIGVARRAAPEALRAAGADLVVGDLGELVP